MAAKTKTAAVADGFAALQDITVQEGQRVTHFSFGEPEGVLDRRELFDLLEVTSNGKWYEPPLPPRGLAKALKMAAHHQSAILFKRNLLGGSFKPHPLLSKTQFDAWALDYLVFGDGYIEEIPNRAGRAARFERSPAIQTRVGVKKDSFFFLKMTSDFGSYAGQEHEFQSRVFHLKATDVAQEIYGSPEYMAALNSGLLNEAATLFRRRYYKNGSHAGFILYVSDTMQDVDAKKIEESMANAKGVGNFRNLFLHIPNGKKDGVQIIPIGEAAAKDEFLGIKNTTRDDILAAHRVPPQLLGIIPTNNGGFGPVGDAARTFFQLEIVPLQARFRELNDWLGQPVVNFMSYDEMTGVMPA